MNIIISAITSNNLGLGEAELEDMKSISGKLGAICYLQDDYYIVGQECIANEKREKSIKRFNRIISNGHHSIADHCYVTIVFENISKIQAMILNSTQCYNTSEKSARYTVFTNNTEEEDRLYNKWKKYIIDNNENLGLNIEDPMKLEKIANENARYFLSVFNKSTTMAYTASIRQWNYIIDWLFKIEDSELKDTDFNRKLKEDLHELVISLIKSNIYIEQLRDNKDRNFSFLSKQTEDISLVYSKMPDEFGINYNTTYKGSFAQLAQAQRHRTIKYYMIYDGSEKKEYFIPEFLTDEKVINEWLSDMELIESPQGQLVTIVESGSFDNFLLKCKERLCYRAQVEICKQTAKTLKKYCQARYNARLNGSPDNDILLESLNKYIDFYYGDFVINPKCIILGGCKEPCGHCKDFLNRTY